MLSKTKKKAVFSNVGSFASTIFAAAADEFGPEILYLDPTTVRCEFDEFIQEPVNENILNKFLGAQQLVTTDSFYNSLPDFINICNAFSGDVLNLSVWDPANVEEICWGIVESHIIWPPDKSTKTVFAPDILEYIKLAVKDEGLIAPPDILLEYLSDASDWIQVQTAFSEDPKMFQSIREVQQGQLDELNNIISMRLGILVDQFIELGLIKDVEEAKTKLFAAPTR